MIGVCRRPASPSSSQPPSSSGLGPLLFECARLLDEVAQAEVNREAGRRLLTPALVAVAAAPLARGGVGPTELARRVDVSKQAVGQALRGARAPEVRGAGDRSRRMGGRGWCA